MSTKRILRWGIVLFLLAALPAMTVALAQEQEPAIQTAVVSEAGESQAVLAWDWYESESNNTRGSADDAAVGYVVGAKIDYMGDVDYFELEQSTSSSFYLFDTDTYGYLVGREICLEDNVGNTLSCYENSGGPSDAMLLYNAFPDDEPYYIKISDHTFGGTYPKEYQLIVSAPLLVSSKVNGTVAGISFQHNDILAHYDLENQGERWVMFFDGSDVGLNSLTNVAVEWYKDWLVLSVGANQTLPGLGTVKPHDILLFDPSSVGPNTSGTFFYAYRGSDMGLTTTSEKLDALDASLMCDNEHTCDYVVSTTGVATDTSYAGYMKVDDEDVFGLSEDWGGSLLWRQFFDVNGVNDGPNPVTVNGLPGEDVFAFSSFGYLNYFTILGTGRILGHPVNQKDIFVLDRDGLWYGYYWRGPQHGWNYNLDAFEVGFDSY